MWFMKTLQTLHNQPQTYTYRKKGNFNTADHASSWLKRTSRGFHRLSGKQQHHSICQAPFITRFVTFWTHLRLPLTSPTDLLPSSTGMWSVSSLFRGLSIYWTAWNSSSSYHTRYWFSIVFGFFAGVGVVVNKHWSTLIFDIYTDPLLVIHTSTGGVLSVELSVFIAMVFMFYHILHGNLVISDEFSYCIALFDEPYGKRKKACWQHFLSLWSKSTNQRDK